MATTRISDLIVPEVFENYVADEIVRKTNLVQSGAVTRDGNLDRLLAGGGAGGSSAGSPGIDSWTNTGINGGINVTKLVQAAREDPQATLAVARKAGVEKEVLNRFGYLFKKQ